MKNFDEERKDDVIDTNHNIKLVASVSYDRNKKAFNYDKLSKDAFKGSHTLEELKRKQDEKLEEAKKKY